MHCSWLAVRQRDRGQQRGLPPGPPLRRARCTEVNRGVEATHGPTIGVAPLVRDSPDWHRQMTVASSWSGAGSSTLGSSGKGTHDSAPTCAGSTVERFPTSHRMPLMFTFTQQAWLDPQHRRPLRGDSFCEFPAPRCERRPNGLRHLTADGPSYSPMLSDWRMPRSRAHRDRGREGCPTRG